MNKGKTLKHLQAVLLDCQLKNGIGSINVSNTRKSLVKGERFMRGELKTWVLVALPSKRWQAECHPCLKLILMLQSLLHITLLSLGTFFCTHLAQTLQLITYLTTDGRMHSPGWIWQAHPAVSEWWCHLVDQRLKKTFSIRVAESFPKSLVAGLCFLFFTTQACSGLASNTLSKQAPICISQMAAAVPTSLLASGQGQVGLLARMRCKTLHPLRPLQTETHFWMQMPLLNWKVVHL